MKYFWAFIFGLNFVGILQAPFDFWNVVSVFGCFVSLIMIEQCLIDEQESEEELDENP